MFHKPINKIRTVWIKRFRQEGVWVVMRYIECADFTPQLIVGYHYDLAIANAKTLVELSKLAESWNRIVVIDDDEEPIEIELIHPAVIALKSYDDFDLTDLDSE